MHRTWTIPRRRLTLAKHKMLLDDMFEQLLILYLLDAALEIH